MSVFRYHCCPFIALDELSVGHEGSPNTSLSEFRICNCYFLYFVNGELVSFHRKAASLDIP